jgi:hypothetical protein
VKKLIVSAALLLGTVTSHQAAACDMGAIETWVVRSANPAIAQLNQLPKISANNCLKLQPDV